MELVGEAVNVDGPRRRRGESTMPALTARETAVLRLRYGDPQRVATPQEVAAELGTSVLNVFRTERRALRKLRQSALGPLGHGFEGWDEV